MDNDNWFESSLGFYIIKNFDYNTRVENKNIYIYTEDITRWRENMKLIFEWKKYFMSMSSERVKYFFHPKINFISSNQRVIFF